MTLDGLSEWGAITGAQRVARKTIKDKKKTERQKEDKEKKKKEKQVKKEEIQKEKKKRAVKHKATKAPKKKVVKTKKLRMKASSSDDDDLEQSSEEESEEEDSEEKEDAERENEEYTLEDITKKDYVCIQGQGADGSVEPWIGQVESIDKTKAEPLLIKYLEPELPGRHVGRWKLSRKSRYDKELVHERITCSQIFAIITCADFRNDWAMTSKEWKEITEACLFYSGE